MSERIVKLYQQLAETADLDTTDGLCSLRTQAGGKVKLLPITINKKRLVLPVREQLRGGDWESRVVFHPLQENTSRGESPVLDRYRSMLNLRLNHAIGTLMRSLLSLAASPAEHTKLNPEQAEYLTLLKHADERALEIFDSIVDKMPRDKPSQQFAALYLRRSAKLAGREYFRAGVVHFPFYAELLDEKNRKEGKILGVTVRKTKDFELFKNLADIVIPHQGEENYYSVGYDGRVGPSLAAIMKAYLAVISPLNDKIELFKDVLDPVVASLAIPADWYEEIDQLETFVKELREMPPFEGNEGAEPGAPTKVQTSAPLQAAQTVPALGASAPCAAPYGMPASQQQQASAQQPQQPLYGMPHPAAQTGQAPHGATPGAGNFDQALRSNPALAAAAGFQTAPAGYYPYGQAPMYPQQPPRATPNSPYGAPQQAFYGQPYGQAQPQGYYGQPAQPAQPAGYGYPQGGYPPSHSGL